MGTVEQLSFWWPPQGQAQRSGGLPANLSITIPHHRPGKTSICNSHFLISLLYESKITLQVTNLNFLVTLLMSMKQSRTATIYGSKLVAIKQSWFNSYFWTSASESAIKFFKYKYIFMYRIQNTTYTISRSLFLCYVCLSTYAYRCIYISYLHLESLARKTPARKYQLQANSEVEDKHWKTAISI